MSEKEEVIYLQAESESDKKEALNLLYKEYLNQGYIHEGEPPIGKEFYVCNVIVAKIQGKVVGTISIIEDSKFGLPMDKIYKEEIDVLRGNSKKIAEVGRLAIEKDLFKGILHSKAKTMLILWSLFKQVLYYSKQKNLDFICIAINPKHGLFYKSLGFEDIGKEKSYPLVNNAPALAKVIDLHKVKNLWMNYPTNLKV